MKTLVIFLLFIGIFLVTTGSRSTVSVPVDETSPASPQQQPKVSQMFSRLFDESGPFVSRFVYNYAKEDKISKPEDTKMQLY